jgi:DNA-binding NarL/FixJ family response regulator
MSGSVADDTPQGGTPGQSSAGHHRRLGGDQPLAGAPTPELCILVVAGKRFFAEAIRSILEAEGIGVAGVLTSSAVAVEAAVQHAPDVVLMDLELPEMEGLKAGRAILGQCHRTRLVGLVNQGGAAVLRTAAEAGFVGLLPKQTSPRELVRTVRAAASGAPLRPPEGPAATLPKSRGAQLLERLTERERTVLAYLIEGHSSKQIAEQMDISPHTVRTHVQNLLQKLGVRSRLEATTLVLRGGGQATP